MTINDFQPFYELALAASAIIVFALGYIGGSVR
jgi:hypothetical protein